MLVTAALFSLLATTEAFMPASTSGSDVLAAIAKSNQALYELSNRTNLPSGYGSPQRQCSLKTAHVRREWDSLSHGEREEYIQAVQCLMSKPAISGALAPGAKNRFDDFCATHINQTMSIHGTGNFLSWHRYFTHTYEQALRNECGYTGFQPYINWPRYADDLLHAPIFDGGATSMSGNGCPDPSNNGTNVPSNAAPDIVIPPGVGGGCVDSGPFANMTVSLGPVSPALNTIPPNPQTNGLGSNPRCLRRDLSQYVASRWSTDLNATNLLTQSANISAFQTTLQGDFPAGFLGMHTAGHFLVGGDPGGDLFSSPCDPYFYLQHAQIDRMWWIWQNLDPWTRTEVVGGTITINNNPPSRNTNLEDIIELGLNAPGISIRNATSTLGGPFCYTYE